MQTVYYSLMRILLACLVLAGTAFALPAQTTSSAPAAQHNSISDSHEGVTISVDPWTTASRYKEKFPKKSPFAGGVIAIFVRVQNDNDQGIRIDAERIRLLVEIDEEDRQELEPLSADEVADAVLLKDNGKDPTARRNPLPIPVGKPRPSRDANWTAMRDACQNAGVPTKVIGAHSFVEGLIYFNLRGEVDLLHTARLYLPSLTTMGSNQPISYFDIRLGKDAGS
jgi:ABC-type transport system substrate-binding protein